MASFAWIATLAVGSIITGRMIQALIILNSTGYQPQNFHGAFLSWAVIIVCIFVNTVVAGILPFLEGAILIIHIMGFIAILVTLVYLSPRTSAEQVFFRSLNEGNWPTQGLSYCVGFIGNVATFIGADAAIHMAEEIENAAMNVPRAIVTTVVLNGSMGWAMVLAILFCLGDIGSVIVCVPESLLTCLQPTVFSPTSQHSSTGFPFIQVFYNGTGQAGGYNNDSNHHIHNLVCRNRVLCHIKPDDLVICQRSRSPISPISAKGLSEAFHLRLPTTVHPRTRVPVVAVIMVAAISCLLNGIYIGSSTAFSNVISMSVCGLYASYLLPCSFLLWRRVTGQIKPYRGTQQRGAPLVPHSMAVEDNGDPDVLPEEQGLEWGPWRIPGWLGVLNNSFACIFGIWVIFWDFWPTHLPVTAQNMNYSLLVTGSIILFGVVRYFIGGNVTYRGPLVDYEVKGFALGRV
ncbi:amino acid permease-domain-containing protein [Apiospora aurea]|uniref:Amino acid permease-domain-containing protein n=1 Tax=Apiospora aurea TaxID=335848 RepID=A0ABR1QK68_9PEZI